MAETRRRALIGAALQGDLRPRLARRDHGADRRPAGRLARARAPLFRRQGRSDPRHDAAPARRVRRRRSSRDCAAPTGRAARLSAIVRGSFGPEQFHRATISAWLTFYAWALRSPRRARLLRHLPAAAAQQPRPRAGRLVPPGEAARIAEGLGALIDGVYLREALRGRPTVPADGDRDGGGLSRPRARRRRPGGRGMITVYGRATSSNVQAVMWGIGELGLACERLDYGHVYGGTDTAGIPGDEPERARAGPPGRRSGDCSRAARSCATSRTATAGPRSGPRIRSPARRSTCGRSGARPRCSATSPGRSSGR